MIPDKDLHTLLADLQERLFISEEELLAYVDIIKGMSAYYAVSSETLAAFLSIVRHKTIRRGEYFLQQGDVPKSMAFVQKGLFSYYHIVENGDAIIKKFFYEQSFVASTAAIISHTPSLFAIEALEDSDIIEYSTSDFYRLVKQYPDFALFHINYIEKNWIVAKEPLEISLKYRTAKERYTNFLVEYKSILNRLKQHQIASFLGVTPTQLSRIRREL